MAGSIAIERAKISDAKMLVQLSVATFRDTFSAENRKEDMDKYIGEAMSLERLTAELADEQNLFYLAWYHGRLAGFVKMRAGGEPGIEAMHPMEIERIYVLQDFQKKHIGAAMMQHCIDLATAHGHDMVWLGVWEYNYRAVNFYKQWGFEICGSHPFQLGDDLQTDVLMRKMLQATVKEA